MDVQQKGPESASASQDLLGAGRARAEGRGMRRRGDALKGKSTYTGGVPTWWHRQRQGAKAGSSKSCWGMKTRASEYGLGCGVTVVVASHPAGSWRLRSLDGGTGRRRGRAGVRALRGESEQKEERGGHVLGGGAGGGRETRKTQVQEGNLGVIQGGQARVKGE